MFEAVRDEVHGLHDPCADEHADEESRDFDGEGRVTMLRHEREGERREEEEGLVVFLELPENPIHFINEAARESLMRHSAAGLTLCCDWRCFMPVVSGDLLCGLPWGGSGGIRVPPEVAHVDAPRISVNRGVFLLDFLCRLRVHAGIGDHLSNESSPHSDERSHCEAHENRCGEGERTCTHVCVCGEVIRLL
jgi:hypothetical protein